MVATVRVGLLVSSDTVHAFEAKYIEDIVEDKRFDLVSVLLFQTDQRVGGRKSLWDRWSKKHLYPNMIALAPRKLQEIVGPKEALKVQFIKKGQFSYYATDASLESIRHLDLDVILSCQYRIIRGEILDVAKAGVWSFHADDEENYRGGPAGFWENYHGDPLNGAILQKLTNKLDGGVILRKGWFATDLCSLSRTQDQVFFEAAAWVKSALLELWNSPDYVAGLKPSSTSAKVYHDPTNLQMLCFLVTLGYRKTIKFTKDFLFYEAWNVAIVPTPITKVDTDLAEWFPERKWPFFQADPFGEPGKLLVEEYNYQTDIGVIKTVFLNSNNQETSRKTFIDNERHHSYPFILQTDEGVFVIPESLQRKKTLVYQRDTGAVEGELLQGLPIIDPSIHFDGERYWLFCTCSTSVSDGNASLFLFHSKNICGPYHPHLLNPVKSDVRCSRPAGSFFTKDGKLHRSAQDCSRTYGGAISIMRIERLSLTEFEETVISRIEPVAPYNAGIHHLSNFGNSACVIDGKREAFSLRRLLWQLFHTFREPKIDHLLPIDASCTLALDSWHSYVQTQGVSEDGWCAKSCIFRFETTRPMKLHFLVEFPGWQKATMQMLKVSANGVIVRSSLEPGTTKIEIPLVPGIKKIRIIANTIFKMPSPDPRECSIRIKELNFHIIE
jgi:hypothetical protein